MTMFEIFAEAQKGEAFRNLGAMVGLDPKKTEELVAALLPAFSLGLRRKARDPFDFVDFLRDYQGPALDAWYDAMRPAFAGPARTAGQSLVKQLFGAAAADLAAAAAARAGVAADTVLELMPPMAATLVAGMHEHMKAIPGLHEWMDAFAAEPAPTPKRAAGRTAGTAAAMGDMMKAWTEAAMAANPFMAMLDAGQIPEPEEEPEPEAPEERKHPMAAFFDLFDPGVAVRDAEAIVAAMAGRDR